MISSCGLKAFVLILRAVNARTGAFTQAALQDQARLAPIWPGGFGATMGQAGKELYTS
jgi:hypothetical protein